MVLLAGKKAKGTQGYYSVVLKTTEESAYSVQDMVYQILGWRSEAKLVEMIRKNNMGTLNFDLEGFHIVASHGKFTEKLQPVILREYQTKKEGKRLGFRVLSVDANGGVRIVDMVTQDRLLKVDFQNAFTRSNTIVSKSNSFPVITYVTKKPVNVELPVEEKQKTTVKKAKPAVDMFAEFTNPQKRELQACINAGVDYHIIYDTRFTPEQMRILWVAKRDGHFPEEYADPDISEEAMKFYASHINTLQDVYRFKYMTNIVPMPTAKFLALQTMIEGALQNGIPFFKFLISDNVNTCQALYDSVLAYEKDIRMYRAMYEREKAIQKELQQKNVALFISPTQSEEIKSSRWDEEAPQFEQYADKGTDISDLLDQSVLKDKQASNDRHSKRKQVYADAETFLNNTGSGVIQGADVDDEYTDMIITKFANDIRNKYVDLVTKLPKEHDLAYYLEEISNRDNLAIKKIITKAQVNEMRTLITQYAKVIVYLGTETLINKFFERLGEYNQPLRNAIIVAEESKKAKQAVKLLDEIMANSVSDMYDTSQPLELEDAVE